ncbi:Oidioi.mRNA.OKI2018_I69.XSR.g16795.t1.cds [Oikopleura dioica]|uniref:Oidioi.mRNA.OKI2018_I69.XSR.g16795.t1.cds n=1 Tax=Oikopleura dioica TaxID=34765 RepID=A0ABN7SME1_OIKDI|nr:Oidioi.mRNA.OKI2018_I69.XSR.g16795.t1.cds [Oikopleura dioica]
MSMFAYFGLVTSGTSLQFKICSCVLGICVSALGSYPNMMELSKKSWKWMIGLVNSGMWTASVFWLILVTYFIRDWRLAFKVYSSPMLIAVFYIFYYPESPRWLLEQGRIEEAVDWIMKIAKTNGVQIERSSILEQLQALKPKSPSEKHEEETICNYLKRTAVSGRFFILIWIHSCAMLLWYNIVFATGQMHCCIYVTFAVMVLLEGPLRISYNAILLKRIRRKGIAFFLSASSAFFMIMLVLQKYEEGDEFWIPKLVFGVASKLMIQSYMSYMFTMVSEVSPTFIRARAMSALLAFGNLSSTCAPLILSFFGTSTPIFALIALLSATLIFLLPPVIKSDLPDSLDDAEALALTATRIFAK